MVFKYLEQRMAQGYIDMLPPFVPDAAAPVSVSEQETFYRIVEGLYRLAFDQPLLFVTQLHEDDAYPSRYKKPYGKPDLIKNMRKFTSAMDALLGVMFRLGQGAELKPGIRQREALRRIGVTDFDNLPPAWIWMSTRPDACLTFFRHCMFNKNYPYTSDIYSRLLGGEPFRRLEAWMTERGYRRYDIYETDRFQNTLMLTYINPAWSAQPPRGGYEYKIIHTGISAQYDDYVKTPASFGLLIPGGLKNFLKAADDMPPGVRNFILSRAKRCDSCRYCIQTDKTGRRPLAAVEVENSGERLNICPYFPGYYFAWNTVDDALFDDLIATLTFMDESLNS